MKKIKTLTLLVITFSVISNFSYSQSKIGINLTPSFDNNYQFSHGYEYSTGVLYETGNWGRFSLRGNLNYNYLRLKFEDTGVYLDHAYPQIKETHLNFLSVRADVKFQFLKNNSRSNLYVSLGPQIRFLISGHNVSIYDHQIEIEPDFTPCVSILASIGYSYKFSDRLGVFAEPVFGFPVYEEPYHWSLGIMTGLCLDLTKK